jgi:Tol biopolymer transport system component/tRNA A-37 threonylcarbamoyl transferase component Bud32
MELTPGVKLGPYEIISRLGAGGMGEVWRARDPRLNREVAIKISAQQFTDRFEREARAIAALNHPNVCTLHDIGPNYLVMELIEGPTLADRIAQGPIPLDEALTLARQIADALEAAHEKSIVHRDLKPGNIKIRPDGSVKVLDFGLAKAGAEDAPVSSDSPTMMHIATQVGVILGTAAYMAPEQARGKAVDRRADIWAFGVVLHEMVTGKRLFQGEDLTVTLASVVMKEPDILAAPPELRRLLTKCLQKDPKNRLRWIGDAWDLLEEIPSRDREGAVPVGSRSNAGWMAATGLCALVAAVVSFVHFREKPPAAPGVTRFRYTLPKGQSFTRAGRHVIAISPDGTKLAYVANQQLYLRSMDQLDAEPIRGTNEDPAEPVFSPDGQWIAYFTTPAGNVGALIRLKKIAVTGGAPVTLSGQVPAPYGATWSGGNIVFAVNSGGDSSITTVPDSGGPLRVLWKADSKKERVAQPQLLEDGKHMIFVSAPLAADSGAAGEGDILVQTLDGGDRRRLVSGGTDPHVLPSGKLVYVHDGTLFAVSFDIRRLAVTGGPVPVLEGVTQATASLAGQFAISQDGALAFAPGSVAEGTARRLLWVDRDGREQASAARPKAYAEPRLSPDGARIAVRADDEERDIWIFDFAKATLTRETFGPSFEYSPMWAPDGRSLFFASGPNSSSPGVAFEIYRKAADGTGVPEALTEHLQGGYPQSLAPGGKSLIYYSSSTQGSQGGIYQLPLEPKGPAQPLLADSKFRQACVDLSPDGRWIAYVSGESGHDEIYVRPFPAVNDGRWQISSGGGTRPAWARSGRELFFLDAANRMSVIAVQPGSAFSFGTPKTLFDASPYYESGVFRSYDVSADGKRFLMVRDAAGDTNGAQSIVVVSHWAEEVKAKMPAQK